MRTNFFFGGDSDDEFDPGFGHPDEEELSSFLDDEENRPISYPIVDISLRPEDRRALQSSDQPFTQPSECSGQCSKSEELDFTKSIPELPDAAPTPVSIQIQNNHNKELAKSK
ncbi:hypothetical protein EVAR_39521_1 [Eumeta japonica]|uniref:Uncharacterized protein n=1 Tax=Eumeta variegata TaxID=151549 RepID=A0A4C1XL78_EUMVA|nr:hypothetical protein EVAR_39521_1 [Eumeta japonica]